jgi:hypothetical protein
MYCQQCGHKQGSDQHFCRNCGMRLDALVESNGSEIMPSSQTLGIAPLTPRQKGLRLAALFFGIGLVLIPLTFLFQLIFVDKAIYLLVPAITLCLAGLIRAAYAMLLEAGEDVFRKELKRSDSTAWQPSLPPRQVGMGHFVSPNRDTDEMVPPPSATENTTQLLNKDRPHSQ